MKQVHVTCSADLCWQATFYCLARSASLLRRWHVWSAGTTAVSVSDWRRPLLSHGSVIPVDARFAGKVSMSSPTLAITALLSSRCDSSGCSPTAVTVVSQSPASVAELHPPLDTMSRPSLFKDFLFDSVVLFCRLLCLFW